ncbi:MAG: 50S ribosome-binding GTPase [Methylococcales bacterium]|nr:50S ribosome-binding GTPase [Methylococcales bacterium]
MLEFIQLLKQRYQSVLSQQGNEARSGVYQQRIDQLILAEAFMRKGQLLNKATQPLQIAVIGPTQAGKSSLVNVLLNQPVAGVSPLAGYTVHPQGFCQGVNLADCQNLAHYFGRFQQLSQNELSKQRYDCYSLTALDNESPCMPHGVLWDTPDFDSIDSATYREGVIRAIALADVLILVVSKEKYADQSVWEMMAFLETLHQPVLICLNKLTEGSETLLIKSLQEKWRTHRSDPFPDVIPLFYEKQSGAPHWSVAHSKLLTQLAKQVSHKKQASFTQELLQKYWQSWLEPIRAEQQAVTDWQQLCHELMQSALASYQRDFLNHPHHYETFQQALAELLTLLEIPLLAGFLAGARQVLTWPVKQMMKLGRQREHIANTSHEVALLKQIAEHTLIQLVDKLLDQAEHQQQNQWWKALNSVLRKNRPRLLEEFANAAQHYHIDFQQDVEHTAQQLYHKLQQQPLVLNTLRATRVTADAAVIALTLHTGGIGVQDLVIAPAMLTVTSMLTESVIGSYMHKVENELKQQQLSIVKQTLFIDILVKQLLLLPEQLSGLTYFNIPLASLQAAEQQLTEKRHGLRLL